MSVADNLELGAFAARARATRARAIDEVYARFPRLRERADQERARCRAASGRCWRSGAR
jgi:ABC-type branched-subunit amino acid transport system ATPase component